MLTMVIVSVAILSSLAFMIFPRRVAAKASALGNMSHTWLAEERAGLQRY
jgi:hypothetical protein